MPRKYHALKVPKARQDWSKWNLYNLQRMRDPPAGNKTFFQQKWLAKSYLRAYHNPYVREGQWTRMFDRRLPAVVPMDFRYLARTDGSEEATGRGMGLDQEMDEEALRKPQQLGRYSDRRTAKTPYMQMSFHPLERRLDTAIFRALFASSTKQARQFVVHGSVKVNGKKMIYPGYLLNPGDMFSVDPERVLFATGAPKRQTASAGGKKQNAEEGEGEGEEASEGQEESSEECKEKSSKDESEAPESTAESTPEDVKKTLQSLMKRATTITDSAKNDLSGRRLKDMRDFTKTLRKAMSQAGRRQDDKASLNTSVEDLTKLLEEITAKIPQANLPASEVMKSSQPATASGSQDQEPEKQDNYKAQKDAGLLFRALQRARENPIDPTKPYQTPWRPRDYMSAFAFIPRYLEVNQNICSAVYLRHPVARPGLAEVPTPFGDKTSGLAFNWYLRRR